MDVVALSMPSSKVQLSLKEHIEKNSPVLGRNAQYEKTSSIASLPPFLVVGHLEPLCPLLPVMV